MNCRKCRREIDRDLDAHRAVSPPVEHHVAACPGCRSYLAGRQGLLAALRADTDTASPAPRPRVRQEVMRAVRRERETAHAPSFGVSPWPVAAGVFAVLLALLALSVSLRPHGDSSPRGALLALAHLNLADGLAPVGNLEHEVQALRFDVERAASFLVRQLDHGLEPTADN